MTQRAAVSAQAPSVQAPVQTEAIVLRTWPFHESDLVVSLFTRGHGKVKGVARAALKSRKRFGGALEPMTHTRARFAEKARQDLVRLDALEVIRSPLSSPVSYQRVAALEYLAEVLEAALPDHDPHDDVFRLTVAVLGALESGPVWMPVSYFTLWVTRLMGWMPDLARCAACGRSLEGAPAHYSLTVDGLFCAEHRGAASRVLSAESVHAAALLYRSPVAALSSEVWPRSRAEDLRRLALVSLERHLERHLHSARTLAKL
jgi:DNA repair protein RecO (recombination protein O)